MEAASKHLTAFSTLDGSTYQFRVMPFGLKNATARFQKLMTQQVLVGLQGKFCFAYLDDVVIFSDSWDEHLQHVRMVMERLREHGLRCSMPKCTFGTDRVEYLGHVVTAESNHPLPTHIHSVKTAKVPTSKRQLRGFLGMCNWLRDYLERFAEIAAPLTDLLRKDKPFRWTQKAAYAFRQVQQALAKPLQLHRPDASLPFYLQTDASQTGLAAVLYQMHGEQRHVISFASARLNAAESKYHANEQECLAVVWGIRRYRAYLEDKPFTLRTDSRALTWLNNTKDARSKLTRWALLLQEFNFTIEHCPGVLNELPDTLSREPEDDPVPESVDDVSRMLPPQCLLLEVPHLPEAVAAAQAEDADIRLLIQRWERTAERGPMEPGDDVLHQQYMVHEDKLWRKHPEGDKLVAPDSTHQRILRVYHDDSTAGHPGRDETTRAIELKYYWPRLAQTVKEHVRNCLVCAAVKRGPHQQAAPLRAHRISKPWDVVSVDVMGPYPPTAGGNRFILVVTDMFSRWVEAKAVPNSYAGTIIKFLQEDVFQRFGYPRAILSDNGPQFLSVAWDGALERWGTQHWTTPIYHPRANPVERRNQEIKKGLRTRLMGRNCNTWDQALPDILFNLRTRANAATGTTPSKALMGYTIPRPGEWKLRPANQEAAEERPAHEVNIRDINWRQHRFRRRYERPDAPQPARFQPGERVMARERHQNGLLPRWTGPHHIIDVAGPSVYWVDKDGVDVKEHHDNLRRAPRPRPPIAPPRVQRPRPPIAPPRVLRVPQQ